MKIITFITEKGGTGKTTGAREVGGVLAKDYNKKILFIIVIIKGIYLQVLE